MLHEDIERLVHVLGIALVTLTLVVALLRSG